MIDDDRAVRTALGRILGVHHAVTLASGFVDGCAQLANGDYDVILCDVVMPDGSGIDLLEHARIHHPELGARFILMTGAADGHALRAARAHVIDKPFDMRRLEEAIARVVKAQ